MFLFQYSCRFCWKKSFGVQTAFDISINFPLNISFYSQFLLYIFFGIIVAFFGKLFTYTLVKMQDLFNNIKVSRGLKIVSVMSTSSFVLCVILPEVTGGHHLAESLPDSKKLVWVLFFIFIVKLFYLLLFLMQQAFAEEYFANVGFRSNFRKIFGEVLNLFLLTGNDFTVHFIVLGMAAFFVAVVKAPITGAILILEMTGSFHLLLAIATVSVVVFYVTELINQEPIYDILALIE